MPSPDPEARAHSARVQARLRTAIDAGGAIDFAEFMEIALYAPGLGYYSAGAEKLGPGGDYVTAPERAPLFSRCVARQCAEALDALGGGTVLELGPGTGALAAEVLGELERAGVLPERYLLLERSAELRERQRATMAARVPHLLGRVRWLDALPEGLEGVVLANEVLDAMPVHRFRVDEAGPRELAVVRDEAGFAWRAVPPSPPVAEALERVRAELEWDWPPGYESELSLAVHPWVRSLADVLTRGTALLIDYGYPRREYYHPQRARGTLRCHYRHRAHEDPFLWPGLQDISAHVDFTAVAEAAQAAGLEVLGYTTQAHFLIAGGLMDYASASDPGQPAEHLPVAQQVKALTLPGDMGEAVKVIGLGRGTAPGLSGFALRDLRPRL